MSLIPTPNERLARARTDLRLGLPVLLDGGVGRRVLFLAAEGVDGERLAALRAMGPATLAITSKRADTLHARSYDGDLARLVLPRDADADWVASVADPQSDLSTPMKGPFQAERGGDADLHRTAIRLAKAAHLLPAAVVVPFDGAPPFLADRLAFAGCERGQKSFEILIAIILPVKLGAFADQPTGIFKPDNLIL